ncbi:folylpolyglutamate synthase/dihydrofolate synthase family protein [Erythrobacter sp. HL-111]|uniref:bifunctional folylpolyglutamate synthase/dihydrofolate synthase n=1 Tax=Erythrobacter sp. HL-111 TaxID=1798193 RepID=UPI0006DB7EAC|nr:folylpolyglutamate synthase/dihydrofolate synthase family protein [Erythrobacter sp. HL-111]KPP95031.1 MAG: bifunctional dihydrofolate synthase / folylpolyglutamate synthase FolC [Erythrobacteraceae bacterium HL-111]SDS10787.1 dihydrofolate synthase / folylpolyglutamate synthase [Erythrobacter sp. HL-111]
MKPLDFGRSDDPRVQSQLDRLSRLSVPQGRLGLDTIRALMERLGNPHRALPPVFHVAGTNGKGSVCAFLRAMLEAEEYRVHVTTSPHLVRYNERIRLAGKLIDDAMLADLLEEVLDAGEDLHPSFFEVTIAAAFTAFARVPADACVVEVGMGGRFDATNLLEPGALAACGIAALGLDHEKFLLAPEDGTPAEPMARIGFEKAGIAKPGVPLVTLRHDPLPAGAVMAQAERFGAPLLVQGDAWEAREADGRLAYRDDHGALDLPFPALPGAHQVANAGLAIAMLRAQQGVAVSREAIERGLRTATWPARLQRLRPGPLTGGRETLLDGGHNPSAGEVLGAHFRGRRVHLVLGMLANKNPLALIRPLGETIASLTIVPVPGHETHPPEAFGPRAAAAPDLPGAMAMIRDDGLPVLIAGSLYLAGEALRLNGELPD